MILKMTSTLTPALNVGDTIAAIATAVSPGEGGIAVIRLSGPQAQAAVRAVVRIPGAQIWESHRVLYGHALAADGVQHLDEVLVQRKEVKLRQ